MPLSGKAKTTYQRTYMRDYMRRRRARLASAKPAKPAPPDLTTEAGQRAATEAWQKVADAAKAAAPSPRRCVLCDEPASRERIGISDERGRFFVCKPCIIESYQLLSESP